MLQFQGPDGQSGASAILGPFHEVRVLGNRLHAVVYAPGSDKPTKFAARYRERGAGWEIEHREMWPVYDQDEGTGEIDLARTPSGMAWSGFRIWSIG